MELKQQYQKSQSQVKQGTKHLVVEKEPLSQTTADSVCPKCGAHVDSGMKFCEDCGYPLGAQCPHCHSEVEPGMALCSHCGRPVNACRCSFCGADMDVEDKYCPECGNSREGITCPECGTLNFRSFCRKCNAPLNEMARNTLEKVKNDPRVIHSGRLAQELEELEQKIAEIVGQFDNGDNGSSPNVGPCLTEEDRAILNTYKELFGSIAIADNIIKSQSQVEQEKEVRKKEKVDRNLLESAIEEYRVKASEMQSVLDSMIPDPQDPPEVQRNFFCACKIATYSTVKTKKKTCMGWVCNLCGCRHSQPSECTRPDLGGKWIYKDVEVINKITNLSTVYL